MNDIEIKQSVEKILISCPSGKTADQFYKSWKIETGLEWSKLEIGSLLNKLLKTGFIVPVEQKSNMKKRRYKLSENATKNRNNQS